MIIVFLPSIFNESILKQYDQEKETVGQVFQCEEEEKKRTRIHIANFDDTFPFD